MEKEAFPIQLKTSIHHDAFVRLQSDDGSFISEEYDAIVRLVEVTMLEEFPAWLAVVDIAIETKDYMAAMYTVKPPTDFGLRIRLPDGRLGLGRQRRGDLAIDLIEQHSRCNVAIVGVTNLSVPRHKTLPF